MSPMAGGAGLDLNHNPKNGHNALQIIQAIPQLAATAQTVITVMMEDHAMHGAATSTKAH